MKDIYTTPEITVIEFPTEDIITTSVPDIDPVTGLPIY